MENQEEIVCRRCGKCCLANLIAYVTDEDWERWRREGRDDILRIIAHEHAVWAGDHLISSDLYDLRDAAGRLPALRARFFRNLHAIPMMPRRDRTARRTHPAMDGMGNGGAEETGMSVSGI